MRLLHHGAEAETAGGVEPQGEGFAGPRGTIPLNSHRRQARNASDTRTPSITPNSTGMSERATTTAISCHLDGLSQRETKLNLSGTLSPIRAWYARTESNRPLPADEARRSQTRDFPSNDPPSGLAWTSRTLSHIAARNRDSVPPGPCEGALGAAELLARVHPAGFEPATPSASGTRSTAELRVSVSRAARDTPLRPCVAALLGGEPDL